MTFWQATQSDIFSIYPESWIIDLAKLLLCISMLLTFPLPFFACRELLIVMLIHPFCRDELYNNNNNSLLSDDDNHNSLQEPLLPPITEEEGTTISADNVSLATELSRIVRSSATPKNWLLPDDNRQLVLPGHVIITVKLWFIVTCLAVLAPNLGDVLNLVGCASGTLIAFVIPALLSFRLKGYSHLACVLLLVGGAIGIVGTYFSLNKLAFDIESA
jgi:amino acid permease